MVNWWENERVGGWVTVYKWLTGGEHKWVGGWVTVNKWLSGGKMSGLVSKRV